MDFWWVLWVSGRHVNGMWVDGGCPGWYLISVYQNFFQKQKIFIFE